MLTDLSHSNGSYYYANPNGSTYYNSGKSPSSPIHILVEPVLIFVLQVTATPSTTPPAALLPSTMGMLPTRAASRISRDRRHVDVGESSWMGDLVLALIPRSSSGKRLFPLICGQWLLLDVDLLLIGCPDSLDCAVLAVE